MSSTVARGLLPLLLSCGCLWASSTGLEAQDTTLAPDLTQEVLKPDRVEPQKDRRGVRVDIASGDIPVGAFLGFLADYTGTPVLVSTEALSTAKPLRIVAPMRGADDGIVKAVLEVNGWEVVGKTLSGGQETLLVQRANVSPPSEPALIFGANRIFEIASEGLRPTAAPPVSLLAQGVPPEEVTTVIVPLKSVSPQLVQPTLQSLLATNRARARGDDVRIVTVEGETKLVVEGQAARVDYVLRLLHSLDVPWVEDPGERIVELIELEHVDVEEMAQLIQTFLTGTKSSMGTAGRAFPPSTSRSVSSRSARTATRSVSSRSARTATRSVSSRSTHILADARTQKLVVQTRDLQDLEDIRMLVKELDQPDRKPEMITVVYRFRSMPANEAAQIVSNLLANDVPQPTVVAHEESGSLVVKLPLGQRADVEKLLELIDRMAARPKAQDSDEGSSKPEPSRTRTRRAPQQRPRSRPDESADQ